jgi:hypothetical protein
MAWDGSYKAPKKKFRVIGEDKFRMPPQEYFVGDFPDLETGKDAAKEQAGPMNPAYVYDDGGEEVALFE